LHFGADFHLVANQHAAGFEGGIPIQAPVFAVDFSFQRKTGFFIPPRVFHNSSKFNIEGNFFCNAFDGQQPGQFVFTVTHPSGTSKPLNPSKDLAIIVTGISSDASGTIYLYPDRNKTKKIDTFSFKLKKDEAEALFVPGSKQAGWASVWVHKGSFKVKLDQSAHANVAPAPKVRKDTAAPPPSVKAEQTASSGTILNGEAPLMKGARVIKEMAMGANSRVDFEVPASPQEVVDFYKQAMAAKGWQPGMSIVQGPMGVIQLSKGASQITLKAQGDGQKCAVNIALMTR